MAHTPGPWLYRGKSDSIHEQCVTHPYGRQIFQFDPGPMGEDGPSSDDLALILTSPQLLMALEDAIQVLEPLAEQLPSVRSRVEGYRRIVTLARDLDKHP